MNLKLRFLLFAVLSSFTIYAQSFSISGKVIDATDTGALTGVSVSVKGITDSTVNTGGVTDIDGNFLVSALVNGAYNVKFDYVGYKSYTRQVTINGADVVLGVIKITATAKELKGVTIKDKQVRATQNGDTTSFNADAYKTNPDASAEDLVSKMPGVTSDGNGVKVNGESLQQIYVDGKPFFGNDPAVALKNLPAEIIDKIQIFDKLSDQSAFTGFDDGNAQKTMNIITKGSKRQGVFGKAYAGYGTEGTYSAGGNVNFFNGDRRITLIGLSNNINQQNFSAEDLLGVTSGSGGNRGGNRGGGGGRNGGGGSGGGSFGGGGGSNFFVGQQNGITTTNSIGVNYSDNWSKKLKVSGSYFFNGTDNVNNSNITRHYNTNIDYIEQDTANVTNTNHRVNLRFEYAVDSFNTVMFIPGISLQNNNNSTSQYVATDTGDSPLSRSRINSNYENSGYSSLNNLMWQHKFKKQRRTLSINLGANLNEKNGTGAYNSKSVNYIPGDSVLSSLDQRNTTFTTGYTLQPNITYTEPVSKNGQLMFTYNPSWSVSSADKQTYNFNSLVNDYTSFDTTLSNKYSTTYNAQKGGIGYRVGDKKTNFNIGLNFQYATLTSEQVFPYTFTVNRTFASVLPNAMYNYKYADGRNLRIMYRTNTVAPSVTQLQNVLDVTNPQLLKIGNPDLVQDYEHTFIVRYGVTNTKTARNFFVNLFANYINDYIGNATVQPQTDIRFKGPLMTDSVTIAKGNQLTYPVNLNGYFNERAFATYGLPVSFIKSNLNLSGGVNYTRTPGLINDITNYANNLAPSAGLVLSSNISADLDFALSYNGNYNIVTNTYQVSANNNYYSHTAGFRINYIVKKSLVFNTNVTHNYYAAFGNTEAQNYFLWNAYVAYKMLKTKALEARITAFDLLNQNKSITRTVSDTYVENNNSTVLKQYFMFQLTYTIRNFKGQMPELDRPADGPGGIRPGGFGPGGPGGGPGFAPPPGG